MIEIEKTSDPDYVLCPGCGSETHVKHLEIYGCDFWRCWECVARDYEFDTELDWDEEDEYDDEE